MEKNETIKQLVKEINEARRIQEAFFMETLELLRDIKKTLILSPFVDKDRIHDSVINDSTFELRDKKIEEENK